MLSDKNGDGELRHIVLFQVFQFKRRSLIAVAVEYPHLVSKHNLCRQAIVAGNLGKGIVLVQERLAEILTGLTDEVDDTSRPYLAAQDKGVDKHTHGIGDTQVAAPAADGRDTKTVAVGEA